jgi:hypothetical protein
LTHTRLRRAAVGHIHSREQISGEKLHVVLQRK